VAKTGEKRLKPAKLLWVHQKKLGGRFFSKPPDFLGFFRRFGPPLFFDFG
jgi:hypothetical protein